MGKNIHAVDYAYKLPLYQEFMEIQNTDKTKETYRYRLGRWALFLSEHNGANMIDSGTWNDELPWMFYKYLDEQSISWNSCQLYLSAVMQYLWFLKDNNALPFKVTDAKKKLTRVRKTMGL